MTTDNHWASWLAREDELGRYLACDRLVIPLMPRPRAPFDPWKRRARRLIEEQILRSFRIPYTVATLDADVVADAPRGDDAPAWIAEGMCPWCSDRLEPDSDARPVLTRPDEPDRPMARCRSCGCVGDGRRLVVGADDPLGVHVVTDREER